MCFWCRSCYDLFAKAKLVLMSNIKKFMSLISVFHRPWNKQWRPFYLINGVVSRELWWVLIGQWREATLIGQWGGRNAEVWHVIVWADAGLTGGDSAGSHRQGGVTRTDRNLAGVGQRPEVKDILLRPPGILSLELSTLLRPHQLLHRRDLLVTYKKKTECWLIISETGCYINLKMI